MTITIQQLPNELIAPAWPYVGPLLWAGASVDPDVNLEEAVGDVMNGRARVWIILDEDLPLAAFLTCLFRDSDGLCLDVYGLGGKRMLHWGKTLTETMTDYAKANGANRVVFKGRRALQRCYPGVRVVGRDDEKTLIFEKRVA